MLPSYAAMSSPNPRKRPAPGASPVVPLPLQQMPQQFTPGPADQVFRWNNPPDAAAAPLNSFGMISTQAPFPQPIPAPSTALARRPPSRALVTTNQFNGTTDTWASFSDDAAYPLGHNVPPMDEHDNIERLEEMAQRAKREAQAKRKQIPPFVQKLSSFLDESRNTDLIRWSDKGDSFIVLDEDEFAKTLIPELFKHNNYASFVRQLNMYGFHKRVGLSDNSMKASERKNKSPSEYYNPYFRRGHPNLLWLINKPKSGGKGNKPNKTTPKAEGEADSEEDAGGEDPYAGQNYSSAQVGRGSSGAGEVGPLHKKDLVAVKSQLDRLQQQQVAISSLLQKIRAEHTTLFQQALTFQNQHERHENSINAILNFLANVFRKSLEEQGGTQSVQDLLASIIPNAQVHNQNQMPQANVVDLGGFVNHQVHNNTSMGTPKRQQRLLPPIPQQGVAKVHSLASSASPAPVHPQYQAQQMGSVTELFDTTPGDSPSSTFMKNKLQNNPQEGMMKLIQDTNAVSASGGVDLPDMATKTHVNALSNDQRNKMLSIMAGNLPSTNGSSPAPSPTVPAVPTPTATMPPVSTIPTVPVTTAAAPPTPVVPNHAAPNALSPALGSMPPPPPFPSYSHEELDALQRLQEEQASQIDRLTSLLGPLSPSGRIPGIDEHGNPNSAAGYFDSTDIEQYLNDNAFSDPAYEFSGLPGANGTGDGASDFNFNLDDGFDLTNPTHTGATPTPNGGTATTAGTSNTGGLSVPGGGFDSGRIFEHNSPVNTPSPSAATEEISKNDLESPERDPKRRRKG
ncbi:heat-shock transcription factor-1 [Neurospora crassa OR74A]|uniref:Heat-shock transcription factor-1 n=2 Tax=Neurospora crassa TaxID=5141 RepID=Q7SBY0_NEUCR|nr:heat-shock transcription factor-1 [Neurospora crassa OR74A]EAA33926.2 heat-shock transcription factor-1 [Neurospora crassa OR74A]|eukprot:XP_963162.2 heat-shock transcription factor-1 [Neurospora crassa OR74A]